VLGGRRKGPTGSQGRRLSGVGKRATKVKNGGSEGFHRNKGRRGGL